LLPFETWKQETVIAYVTHLLLTIASNYCATLLHAILGPMSNFAILQYFMGNDDLAIKEEGGKKQS
jgi:hypothetical protein